MSGDYTWDQMPEELALQLFDFAQRSIEGGYDNSAPADDLLEWLQNEMKNCAATKLQWPRLSSFCPDLPVPGSEFCPQHLPKEDLDG
jgi:hypothetical protein